MRLTEFEQRTKNILDSFERVKNFPALKSFYEKDPEGVEAFLRVMLKHELPEVKQTACVTARHLGVREVADAVALLLDNKNEKTKVLCSALVALGRIGKPEEVDKIIPFTERHRHNWIRQSAVNAIGNLGNKSHLRLLNTIARTTTNKDEREATVRAIDCIKARIAIK